MDRSVHLTYERERKLRKAFRALLEKRGKSPFYAWLPELVLTCDPGDPDFGWFCTESRTVGVNLAACATIREAWWTILHEVKHYFQHPGWYARYENRLGYSDNPYEIAANEPPTPAEMKIFHSA